MRILFAHHGYFPQLAGAEMMARVLAQEMQLRGHTVQLVVSTRQKQVQRQTFKDISILAVPELTLDLLQGELSWQPELIHLVDTVDPRFPRAALEIARSLHIPFVVTPASAIETWQDPVDTKEVCRGADLLFVLTREEARRFQELGIDERRLIAIGQGAFLAEGLQPEPYWQERLGSGPLILFLGRKIHFKGYELLLKATRLVWKQHPEARFLFLGPRTDDNCQKLFGAYADPRLLELDQVGEYEKFQALNICDLLCLPTLIDVFPLVFIEAWSYGKPVVTASFPGVAEVVRDGVDGLVVLPEVGRLAAAISSLLADPRWAARLGRAGQERVRRELNWDVIMDRIELGYQQLSQTGVEQRQEGYTEWSGA